MQKHAQKDLALNHSRKDLLNALFVASKEHVVRYIRIVIMSSISVTGSVMGYSGEEVQL